MLIVVSEVVSYTRASAVNICAAKSLLSRPACYAAANAYYHAVDIGGWKSWISNG